MEVFKKLISLLSTSQKSGIYKLMILMFFGMIAEMIGLGVIVPVLSLLSKDKRILHEKRFESIFHYLGQPDLNSLIIYSMLFLILIYVLKSFYLTFLSWYQAKFSTNFSAEVTEKLFKIYLSQNYKFHIQRNSAQLLQYVQNDANELMYIFQAYMIVAIEFSAVFGIAIILFTIEPAGALFVLIFLLIFSTLFHWITKKKVRRWGEEKSTLNVLRNQYILQGLGGIKDIKILGRENTFLRKFNIVNKRRSSILIKYTTISSIPRFYLELLAIIGLSMLIIVVVIQSKSTEGVLPVIGIFLAAAFRMLPSISRTISAIQMIKHSEPIVNNIFNEFKLSDEIIVLKDSYDNLIFNNSIELKNVSFQYPGSNINAINSISLSINKGDIIGFIGKSGSGKSTLIDIIIGILEPTEGMLLVDNYEISKSLRSWQKNIGYVPQNIYLTDDTLRNNIAFGVPEEDINDDCILKSVKDADLHELVESLPEKLDTVVGERGIRLSGGQRQRIGIARALYHSPTVLVLDEATSALDVQTEKNVMESILKLRKERTIIIVAHRMSTVENCNQIFEIQKGKIVVTKKPLII